jgi:5-methylthioadenosine/S-adenosylhomocysteine deaminase
MKTVIRADRVITMNHDNDIIKDGIVVLDNDTICYVGKDEQMYSKSADITIWRRGGAIIPGLINTHAHLGFTLLRGLVRELPLMRWLREEIHKMEPILTKHDRTLSTEIGILEMINSGITTICDFNDVSVAAPIFTEIGERGVLSTVLSDSWFGEMENSEARERYDNTAKIEQEIKQWHRTSGKMISCMLSPHAPYTCSLGLLDRVKSISDRYKIPIHTHMAEAEEEINWFQRTHNLSPVEFFNNIGLFEQGGLMAHCVKVTEEDILILKEKNVAVAHCPTSNSNLACGIAPVKRMLENRIMVGLGTDSAASAAMTDILSEMKIVRQFQNIKYCETEAIASTDVLRMATINAARCLGLEKEIGSIEEGKKADIVILNYNKFPYVSGQDLFSRVAFSTTVQNVETVFVNGKLLKQRSLLPRNSRCLIRKARNRIAEIMTICK